MSERLGRGRGAGTAPHHLVTDTQLYREWFERVKGRLAGKGIKPFMAISLLQPGAMKELYALDFDWEDTAAMIAHKFQAHLAKLTDSLIQQKAPPTC